MNGGIVVLELLSVSATLALAGILVWALITARRKIRVIENTVRLFVSAPDSQTPSPLAQTVDAAAQVISRAAIAQLKTTFMGEQSGAARGQQKAMANAAIQQFPWLAALKQISPELTGTLTRNPQLLNLASMIFKRGPGGAAAPSSPGGNGRVQEPLFKL